MAFTENQKLIENQEEGFRWGITRITMRLNRMGWCPAFQWLLRCMTTLNVIKQMVFVPCKYLEWHFATSCWKMVEEPLFSDRGQPCQSWITSVKGCWAARLGKIYGRLLRRADFHKASWQIMWPSLELLLLQFHLPIRGWPVPLNNEVVYLDAKHGALGRGKDMSSILRRRKGNRTWPLTKEQNIHVHRAASSSRQESRRTRRSKHVLPDRYLLLCQQQVLVSIGTEETCIAVTLHQLVNMFLWEDKKWQGEIYYWTLFNNLWAPMGEKKWNIKA